MSFPDGTTAERPRRAKKAPIPAGRLERDVGRQPVFDTLQKDALERSTGT